MQEETTQKSTENLRDSISKFLKSAWELIQVVIMAAVIVIPIRMFIFQPFIVSGSSMQNNFWDKDYLIIDELSYRFNPPQRGDVIVFKYPMDQKQRFIKRIIGLPGEKIEIKNNQINITDKNNQTIVLDESPYLHKGTVTIMDLRINLGEHEYFVMGDNRLVSYDSRMWGPLPEEMIVGKVFIRPFSPKLLFNLN